MAVPAACRFVRMFSGEAWRGIGTLEGEARGRARRVRPHVRAVVVACVCEAGVPLRELRPAPKKKTIASSACVGTETTEERCLPLALRLRCIAAGIGGDGPEPVGRGVVDGDVHRAPGRRLSSTSWGGQTRTCRGRRTRTRSTSAREGGQRRRRRRQRQRQRRQSWCQRASKIKHSEDEDRRGGVAVRAGAIADK